MHGPPPIVPDHAMLRIIGRGSYGEVWLARNIMGTYRAVKVVYRSTFEEDRPYEREFAGIRNFEPVSRSHESQVDILHIGRNDKQGYFYYVMELADPGHSSLDEAGRAADVPAVSAPAVIRRPSSSIVEPETYVPRTLDWELKTRGHLPFAECLAISLGLADAVKHLHDHGLVHRDIKPSNIIFVNGVPKLADIGLVTESEATLSYVGAQGFMAPEGPGRPRGNLYSLGKVIYEMCTGRDRMDFPALPGDFGSWPDRAKIMELQTVCDKACQPDPACRYASADELLADLVMLLAGKSVRQMHLLKRGRKWALAAAVLALLAGAGAWAVQKLETRWVKRQTMIGKAEMLRKEERSAGWSSNALALLSNAGQVRVDNDLRAEAAAPLAGLDARVIASLSHTNSGATHIAFDALGRRLLRDADQGEKAGIWDWQTGEFTTFGTSNTGPVWFDRDGSPRQFVSKGDGAFCLLNPKGGEKLREFRLAEQSAKEGLGVPVSAVSADGAFCAAAVVSTTDDTRGQLGVWDTATGNLVKQATAACTALAFSPDNALVATGDGEGRIVVRRLPDLAETASFPPNRAAVHCLAFQQDVSQPTNAAGGTPWLIATGDAGGTIRIYQVPGDGLRTICRGSEFDVYAVAFSPDRMTLASSGRGDVRFWDVATGRLLLKVGSWDEARALAFSPGGRRLAVSRVHGSYANLSVAGVFELESGRGLAVLRGLSSRCTHVAFSRDGKRLAALAHNWEVAVWNLPSNRLERLFKAPQGIYADNAALAFSPDGGHLAFATSRAAVLWDVVSGQELGRWALPRGLCQQLCFDQEGRLLHFQWESEAEGLGGICRVRDLFRPDYMTPLAKFFPSGEAPKDVLLSRQGNFVVVVGEATEAAEAGAVERTYPVKVFNPLGGDEVRRLPGTQNNRDSDSLRRNPETAPLDWLLPRTRDRTLAKLLGTESWRSVRLRSIVALSPDGRLLVTQGGLERGLTLFRTNGLAWRLTVGIDYTCWHAPQFSPNGKLLAVGTAEGTVLVCDIQQTVDALNRQKLGWR